MNIGESTALTTSMTALATKYKLQLALLNGLIADAASKGEFSTEYQNCPAALDRYLKEYGYSVTWDGSTALIKW